MRKLLILLTRILHAVALTVAITLLISIFVLILYALVEILTGKIFFL